MSDIKANNNTICGMCGFLKKSKKEILARKFKFKDGDCVCGSYQG